MTAPDGDLDPAPGPEVAVLLVTAAWSAPARPAATVLRELARRWGSRVHALLVEDADEEMLDLLGVQTIPTWIRLSRATARGSAVNSSVTTFHETTFHDLRATDLHGNPVVLTGAWTITHCRSGALPKHAVDEQFGPDSGSAP
ncbi:hypothetical protein BH708_13185 [Brachybacterium sp. P6-10-X1]|uniref:hypothetical protein n=1 Tax=Brachybacterium sp. P6-10-X1 TaxID=1903186 RepID=UPI000971932B|nr:hypothetical protein [Brachybacterium sp. P6-10-X1]APX33508.1 hypothetical protein BH708_13185 [Brachybacterium sp. P6-10-X1]